MASVALSQVIRRPPTEVFRFLATDHVVNHPRWDPNMTLTPLTDGAMGVGSRIGRNYLQGGVRIDGEMEVVEFDPPHTFGVVINDGPVEMRSRVTVDPHGDDSSMLTVMVEADVPAERMAPDPIRRSIDRMRELIETET